MAKAITCKPAKLWSGGNSTKPRRASDSLTPSAGLTTRAKRSTCAFPPPKRDGWGQGSWTRASRIPEVEATGFLEGPLYVPHFILRELQHFADSPDPQGRRGLEALERSTSLWRW